MAGEFATFTETTAAAERLSGLPARGSAAQLRARGRRSAPLALGGDRADGDANSVAGTPARRARRTDHRSHASCAARISCWPCRPTCRPRHLRRLFPAQVKIGAVEQIRELVNVALPGIAVRPLPVAPRQIPFYAGATYFELDRNSPHWQQMQSFGRVRDPCLRRFSRICAWSSGRSAAEGVGDVGAMSDNPFAEPDDTDRTVIRPAPGGRGPPRCAPPRRPARRRCRPPARAGGARDRRRPEAPERVAPAARPLTRRPPRRCCNCWPAAQHAQRSPTRPTCASARCGEMRAFEHARARRRRADRAAAAGALRAVRQPRRRRAEHALGQPGRLGHALAGRRPSIRKSQAASSSSNCWRRCARTPAIPAGARADVSLPLARLHGPLPAVAARPGGTRQAARGTLRADRRASGAAGRAELSPHWRGVSAPVSAGAGGGAGLGRGRWPGSRSSPALFVWFSARAERTPPTRCTTRCWRRRRRTCR